MDHVRTQLPYALVVAGIGMLVGDIPTAFGLPWIVSYILGMAALYGLLRVWGRTVNPAQQGPLEAVD